MNYETIIKKIIRSLISIKNAEQLATVYLEIFGEDYPAERILLYQRWSEKEKRRKVAADSVLAYSNVLFERSDFKSSVTMSSEASEMYRKLGDTLGEAHSLYQLGAAYWYLEQYDKASDCWQQALKIVREIGGKRRI